MLRILFIIFGLFSFESLAKSDFFANPEIQQQLPGAFALQPENKRFLIDAYQQTISDGDKLVAAINADHKLKNAIARWRSLTFEQQLPFLKKIFRLECELLGIKQPDLIIDTQSYPGKTVYFDFDLKQNDAGKVYLNPEKMKLRDKYDALAFLIHETRHSFQLQQTYLKDSTLAQGFYLAFKAQKELTDLSFSDFLTLLNEYEAFQFGNYVLGRLTDWQIDMENMGTNASQFDRFGKLKINLIQLNKEDAKDSLLERFNQLADVQYQKRLARQNQP